MRPSGLATWEPIFARNLVRATPIEIARPVSASTRRRIVRAIDPGFPNRCRLPDTSRNASSIDIFSTMGVKSLHISKTSSESREYSEKWPGTLMRLGQSSLARDPGIPDRTPYAFAS